MQCLDVPTEDEGVTDGRLSLRDAADALGLDSLRLFRLGRYLHLAPGDKCLTAEVVDRAGTEPDGERRYRAVLDWLLASLQGKGSWAGEPVSGDPNPVSGSRQIVVWTASGWGPGV